MITMLRHALLAAALLICLWTPSFADTAAPTPTATASPGSSASADVNAKGNNGRMALIRL